MIPGGLSRRGSRGDDLPRLRILSGRDDSVSSAVGNGIMAFESVIGAVGRDATDLLALRDLAEQDG